MTKYATCRNCGGDLYNRAEDYGWSSDYWVHIDGGLLGDDLCYWSPLLADPILP